MNKLESQAKSLADRLSKIAKSLNIPYQAILTQFLIERLAVRLLLDRNLSQNLIFKGGYISLRVYQSPRHTIDLDALLTKGILEELVSNVEKLIEKDIGDGVWFKLERSFSLETQGEYGGYRIVLRTGIGKVLVNIKKAQIINLDVGKGDPVVPGPVLIETPFLLGGGQLSWQVYPIETTVAEKLHALVVRGAESSRAKDIFDINFFLPRCSSPVLKKALEATFKYRGDQLPSDIAGYLNSLDFKYLKLGWKSAVEEILNVGTFEGVFKELILKLQILGV